VAVSGNSAEPGTIGKNGIVACGAHTAIQLDTVQPENSKAMDTASAVNGKYFSAGQRLCSSAGN
jgi:methionyl-tRNA formyltransferase